MGGHDRSGEGVGVDYIGKDFNRVWRNFFFGETIVKKEEEEEEIQENEQ